MVKLQFQSFREKKPSKQVEDGHKSDVAEETFTGFPKVDHEFILIIFAFIYLYYTKSVWCVLPGNKRKLDRIIKGKCILCHNLKGLPEKPTMITSAVVLYLLLLSHQTGEFVDRYIHRGFIFEGNIILWYYCTLCISRWFTKIL